MGRLLGLDAGAARLRAVGAAVGDSRFVHRFVGGERGTDLLVWFAVCVPVFLGDDIAVRRPAAVPLLVARLATVAVLGLAVAVSRRRPVLAAAVPAGLGLAASLDLYTDTFMIAQMLLTFLLGRRTAGLRTGLLFFVGVCAAGLALVGLTPSVTLSNWISMVTTALLIIMLPWLAGRYIRQHDELVRTGWALAERLEREQDLIGERVRLLERSRIAGDMHDSLGHELSLVALRAAALQVGPGLDDAAREAAGQVRESAARATERLREIIGVLREDSVAAPVLPPGDTVAALVERAADSGMAVTVSGELGPLPPMADRAAYRVVQESLTNAAKHAPGGTVAVRLGVDAGTGEAVVTVTSAAPTAGSGPAPGTGLAAPSDAGPAAAVVSGGHGLLGLDERVRLAGGRLLARQVDGGFEVNARLPVTARPPVTVGTTPAPPAFQRELALARRRVRRSMIDAIWVPAVAAAVLLALTTGYHSYTTPRSVLDPQVYRDLRVGESRSSVLPRLPAYQANGDERPGGAPADPAGTDECRFYRITAHTPSPAYRLCFTGGLLSHKDEVAATAP